ncbi:MAG TPA: spermidine/putrescine ABC transporter ATP-binding protein, partial [Cyanobacteria bacterium UBA11372]|nr:spermidine/putrescine ABC transporter ATP-binding protein [Cyanobacteria bacterium UBA11372]
ELKSGDRVIVMQPNTAGNLSEPHTPVYVYWRPKDCLALIQE